MNREMQAAIREIGDPTVRNLLSGRTEMQTLHLAVYAAQKERGLVRVQVIGVIDAIMPVGWREVAALPRTVTP